MKYIYKAVNWATHKELYFTKHPSGDDIQKETDEEYDSDYWEITKPDLIDNKTSIAGTGS
jgi:hypothetical protein